MAGTQAGGKEGEARCGLLSSHAGCGCRGRCLYCASSVGQGQGREATFSSVSLCLNHLAKGDASLPNFQVQNLRIRTSLRQAGPAGKGRRVVFICHIFCARCFIFIVRFSSCNSSMR